MNYMQHISSVGAINLASRRLSLQELANNNYSTDLLFMIRVPFVKMVKFMGTNLGYRT